MSNLEELIERLCPDGVEYKTLGEVSKFRRGSFPQPYGNKEWYDGEKAMPFVQVADIGSNLRLVDDTKRKISKLAQSKSVFAPRGSVVISIQGSIGRIAITQYDAYIDRTVAIFKDLTQDIMPKYFVYQLQMIFKDKEKTARGSTLKTITKEEFTNFVLPVPPLEVQREIVQILDNFTATTAELQQKLQEELAARQKQYEFYRDFLLNFNDGCEEEINGNVRLMKLSELGKWSGGKTPSMAEKSFWENGSIPWISSKDMKFNTLLDTQDHITQKALIEASMTLYPANSIAVVTRSGILKHTFPVAYIPFPTTINQDIKILVVNDEILPRYAFHVIQSKGKDILEKTKKQGGTVDSLDFQKVLAFKVLVPTKSIQQKLVDKLDRFDALCNDISSGLPAEIEMRQKQYEYYRDKLLTFKELKKEA